MITRLRDELQGEVGIQLGEAFNIFLDRDDIAWGQTWHRRIEDSLDAVTLLMPINTPAYFNSAACRGELERFLERESELDRDDLVLPIYYVSAPKMDDPARREADPLAEALFSRQYDDWRELRFEPFTSPVFRQRLAELATGCATASGRHAHRRLANPPRTQPTTGPSSRKRVRESRTTRSDASTKREVASERNQPPIRTVDPWGRADHASIGEAIATAQGM